MERGRGHLARLWAERPWREHARLYTDLFGDPAVAASLWPGALGGPRSEAQTLEILIADLAHWQQHHYGPWVFFERSTGVFVGRGGLRGTELAGEPCVELLYAVRPDSWGRGYAQEMAAAALAQARRLGLTEVVCFTTSSNLASQRVMQKAGMHFESVFERAGLPHRLARVSLRSDARGLSHRARACVSGSSQPGGARAQGEGTSCPRAI
jgi:RimJ/RimL family protein N-acetyltransferase